MTALLTERHAVPRAPHATEPDRRHNYAILNERRHSSDRFQSICTDPYITIALLSDLPTDIDAVPVGATATPGGYRVGTVHCGLALPTGHYAPDVRFPYCPTCPIWGGMWVLGGDGDITDMPFAGPVAAADGGYRTGGVSGWAWPCSCVYGDAGYRHGGCTGVGCRGWRAGGGVRGVCGTRGGVFPVASAAVGALWGSGGPGCPGVGLRCRYGARGARFSPIG